MHNSKLDPSTILCVLFHYFEFYAMLKVNATITAFTAWVYWKP